MADISKIKLNGSEYNIKDSTARNGLNDKQDTINDLETIRSGAGAGATAIQSVKVGGSALTPDGNKAVDITSIPSSVTGTTQSTSDDSTKLATTAFVHDVVDELPEPMVFKSGMILTADSIDTTKCSITVSDPVSASDIKSGYTYKVTTISGTYTGTIKVGDTFIAKKDTPKVDATWVVDTDWTIVPSGDETGYVVGKASGTTQNNLVKWGADGYTVDDSGIAVETSFSGTSDAKVPTSKSIKTNVADNAVLTGFTPVVTPSVIQNVASTDTITDAMEKLDNNTRLNETNIGKVQTQANWNTNNGVKNLLDLSKYKELNPSIVSGDNLVFHGVTWAISNSSGLTASGTADSSGSYPSIYSATLPIGTYYLTGGDSTIELLTPDNRRESGQGLTIEITASTAQPYAIRGYVPPSTAITGTHNIKPMLRQVGDSTYQPYALPNTKITPELIELVDSGAKNELNVTATSSGICTVNSDGSITVNGTVGNADIQFVVRQFTAAEGVKLRGKILSGCPSGGGSSTYGLYLQQNQSPWASYGNVTGDYGSTISDSIGTTGSYLLLVLRKNQTISNVTFYPMICSKAAWDVSQKYVPYRPTYEETVEQVATNENNILNAYGGTVNKNKLDYTLSTLKAINTAGAWSNNVYTRGNTTFTVNDDNTIDVTSLGTPNNAILFLNLTTPNVYGGLRLNGCPNDGSSSTYHMNIELSQSPYSTLALDVGNGSIVGTTSGNINTYIKIDSQLSETITFKPMISDSTDTPEYQPYTYDMITISNLLRGLANQ